jgi:hypothetical protein
MNPNVAWHGGYWSSSFPRIWKQTGIEQNFEIVDKTHYIYSLIDKLLLPPYHQHFGVKKACHLFHEPKYGQGSYMQGQVSFPELKHTETKQTLCSFSDRLCVCVCHLFHKPKCGLA